NTTLQQNEAFVKNAKKEVPPKQRGELLKLLKTRFEKNTNRPRNRSVNDRRASCHPSRGPILLGRLQWSIRGWHLSLCSLGPCCGLLCSCRGDCFCHECSMRECSRGLIDAPGSPAFRA